MSSKKSKSLENINKIKGIDKNKVYEKALLHLYRKGYEEEASNRGSKIINQAVTTIDLSLVSKHLDQTYLKPLASTRLKTNFIKKNIDYVTSLQLQSSSDNIS